MKEKTQVGSEVSNGRKEPSLKSDLIYLLVMSLRFLMSMEQNHKSYLYSSVILKYFTAPVNTTI